MSYCRVYFIFKKLFFLCTLFAISFLFSAFTSKLSQADKNIDKSHLRDNLAVPLNIQIRKSLPLSVFVGSSYPHVTITIEKGNTLYSLARFYNTTVKNIMKANNISNPKELIIGMKLIVPIVNKTKFKQNSSNNQSYKNNKKHQLVKKLYHVKPGDNLFSISHKFGLSIEQLSKQNNITYPLSISVGQILKITYYDDTQNVVKKNNPIIDPQIKNARQKNLIAKPILINNQDFKGVTKNNTVDKYAWQSEVPVINKKYPKLALKSKIPPIFRLPVRGSIISHFGTKPGGKRNDGVNFDAPIGTPVMAAADGIVIYTGTEINSYGKLILIQHDTKWVTAYAHNSKFLVETGASVLRGEKIALVGNTGSVDRPQLHFEIRNSTTPIDPAKLITLTREIASN